MIVRTVTNSSRTLYRLSAAGVSSVPLLFTSEPGTPLRVLAVGWYHYVCRSSGTLQSRHDLQRTSFLIWTFAFLNRVIDRKPLSISTIESVLSRLDAAGISEEDVRAYVSEQRRITSSFFLPAAKAARLRLTRERREESLRLLYEKLFTWGGDRSHRSFEQIGSLLYLIQLFDDFLDVKKDLSLEVTSYLSEYPRRNPRRELRHQSALIVRYILDRKRPRRVEEERRDRTVGAFLFFARLVCGVCVIGLAVYRFWRGPRSN